MEDPEFGALLFVLLSLLTGAVVFCTKVERWSVIDALYLSGATMATRHLGELISTA